MWSWASKPKIIHVTCLEGFRLRFTRETKPPTKQIINNKSWLSVLRKLRDLISKPENDLETNCSPIGDDLEMFFNEKMNIEDRDTDNILYSHQMLNDSLNNLTRSVLLSNPTLTDEEEKIFVEILCYRNSFTIYESVPLKFLL